MITLGPELFLTIKVKILFCSISFAASVARAFESTLTYCFVITSFIFTLSSCVFSFKNLLKSPSVKIPIIFLQHVTGFMVGSKSEKGGIIKNGAKLVNAVSNSIVPKITIIIGNSYGAGNYAMCGKAYDPRFIFAWPNSKIAVMGGEQAAKVIMQLNKKTYKKDDPEYREIIENYNKSASAYNAASNLWIDKIIDPAKTREAISKSLEVSCMKEINESYTNGVMQT